MSAACNPWKMSCCGLQYLFGQVPGSTWGGVQILALGGPRVNIERCVKSESGALSHDDNSQKIFDYLFGRG
jgi:hypothetical protein